MLHDDYPPNARDPLPFLFDRVMSSCNHLKCAPRFALLFVLTLLLCQIEVLYSPMLAVYLIPKICLWLRQGSRAAERES